MNVGDRETRIAVLEENKLVELHFERSERVVGSLYKCRVANVLAGMDAAFVDIGLERNAFLYVGDVLPTGDDSGTSDSDSARRGAGRQRFGRDSRSRSEETAAPSAAPARDRDTAPAGHQPNGADEDEAEAGQQVDEIVAAELEDAEEVLLSGEASAAAEMLAEVEAAEEDEEEEEDEEPGAPADGDKPTPGRRTRPGYRRSMLRNQRIRDVLKVGEERLVQVIKGPRSTKGARVSTRVSLPGRYLVLMPEADNLGVSRKIEDAKERDRLKRIGDKLRVPGFGLIIRTEAEEQTEAELQGDMDFLLQTWREVQETAKKVKAPALVQQDLTLLYKTIRDVFGSDVQKLIVDDPAEYEKANELLDRLSPKLKGRIHLYDGVKPIFEAYGVEAELDRLMRRKVFLKSGGSLVIDETEALTVIDVNTSKYTGGSSLNETIVKTNLDAAGEIARQLRLRDIGGIIVIDFIDMNNPRDKQSVVKALELALKKDRSRTKISNISPLGLVEMTRKRTGETLTGFMTDDCPYCKGRGHLASSESVSLAVERDLRKQVNDPKNAKKDALLITCHPEVAELLIGPEGATVAEIERQLQRALFIRSDADAHVEKYSIESGDIGELEKTRLTYRRAQVVECRVTRSLLKEPARCIGWADGYMLDLDDGSKYIGQRAKVRIVDTRRSFATAKVMPGSNRPE
ncbi:MAG TPA: Rne/Rng family ribonuclease [Chthonomonadaceae bacterium]|nr:Rne/Rng family ribonuclease [Chthonomonadaceae bacterium]